MPIKNFIKLVVIASLLTLTLGCSGEKSDSKSETVKNENVVMDGFYKTDVKSRVSFRDNKKMEKIYSEITLKDGKVVYKAYRDGEHINTKSGTYDVPHRAFMMKKDGAPKDDKHSLKDITPNAFKMQNGRFGLEFKKQ